MSSMQFLDLPPEILQHIASLLPANSLSILCRVCRTLRAITQIDSLWQCLCRLDYGVNTIKGWDISYKQAYTKVLCKMCKYGFLGLKRVAHQPYGGLVHISWTEGEISVQRLNWSTQAGSLEPEPLFSIRWDSSQDAVVVHCEAKGLAGQSASFAQSGPYPLLQLVESEEQKVKHKVQLVKFEGRTRRRYPAGFLDHPSAFSQFDLSKGFSCPLLPLEKPTQQDFSQCPVTPGLYRANYGGHGVEILNVLCSRTDQHLLEGLKVTGDPNVPAGNVSLRVHLDKPVCLSAEDQETILMINETMEQQDNEPNVELANPNNDDTDNGNRRQPFCIPLDCYERDQAPAKFCVARYTGFGRIAAPYYNTPSLCRMHFIKFDMDTFGVLWLDLYSFCVFHRLKDNFFL